MEFKRGAGVVYAVADDSPQVLLIDTIQVINGSTVVFKGLGIFIATNYIH